MNKERVQMLIDALRSGEYKQTKYALRRIDSNDRPCYCVTGLMCEICRQHSNLVTWSTDGTRIVEHDGFSRSDIQIPICVVAWFGMKNSHITEIVSRNDSGQPFWMIADWLTRELSYV